MNKHSPGPWRWTDEALVDAKGETVVGAAPVGYENSHTYTENPADARLIVAAPRTKAERDELLEALRRALELAAPEHSLGLAERRELMALHDLIRRIEVEESPQTQAGEAERLQYLHGNGATNSGKRER